MEASLWLLCTFVIFNNHLLLENDTVVRLTKRIKRNTVKSVSHMELIINPHFCN